MIITLYKTEYTERERKGRPQIEVKLYLVLKTRTSLICSFSQYRDQTEPSREHALHTQALQLQAGASLPVSVPQLPDKAANKYNQSCIYIQMDLGDICAI